ncbi:DUF2953 domain-containing protein [Butyrivibrio sp. CB08]|uniref:DUF2953 domain-containing protein n=1 Tax=Butyrivibrio sp. CB08 TaxID=2364879 RepID=UPI001314D451|nr:DUF2953 domain-containing protein [Butyrivibrio sp. CB08]
MTVLKIIGITLLVILAVILVVILLALFVPIFYRIDAHVPETDLDEGFDVNKIDAAVKFSWLLFVIRGGISFPRDKEFTLRVFGIKILPKKEKPEKEKKDKKKKDEEEKPESGVIEMSDMGDEEVAEPEQSTEATSEETSTEAEAAGVESSNEPIEGDEAEDESEDKDFIDVLWNIIEKVQNILETPLNVFEKIQYTISRVCDKIDMIKSTLENDIFKRAFDLAKRKLIRLIKMILPDKCRIDALYGTGDPALTAEILGAYGAIRPFLSRKIKLRVGPDFERKVIYTDTHMKGHITLFTALYIAATCYFNKDIKKTIKRFKKILNS